MGFCRGVWSSVTSQVSATAGARLARGEQQYAQCGHLPGSFQIQSRRVLLANGTIAPAVSEHSPSLSIMCFPGMCELCGCSVQLSIAEAGLLQVCQDGPSDLPPSIPRPAGQPFTAKMNSRCVDRGLRPAVGRPVSACVTPWMLMHVNAALGRP